MSVVMKATELRVTMADGSVWAVPAHVIAQNRARYYADTDPDTSYEAEYVFTLTDSFELEDWAANNMNWSDVEACARQVLRPAVDYQEGWLNGDKTVIREAWEAP